MAINKSMRRVLKALSFDGIEVEASRHLANLKAIDPMKIFHKTIDYKIYNGNHQIPVRIFLPGEKMEDDLAKAMYTNRFILNTDPDKITLIGDSAGGNLAAAVSLMARDQGEFLPKRQILIYPAVNNDYSEESPYLSVRRYGTEYLLTAGLY